MESTYKIKCLLTREKLVLVEQIRHLKISLETRTYTLSMRFFAYWRDWGIECLGTGRLSFPTAAILEMRFVLFIKYAYHYQHKEPKQYGNYYNCFFFCQKRETTTKRNKKNSANSDQWTYCRHAFTNTVKRTFVDRCHKKIPSKTLLGVINFAPELRLDLLFRSVVYC